MLPRSRQLAMTKSNRWKRLEIKAKETGDLQGMGLDEGILTVVVGLWAHGISTTASCQGHLDHGEPYPWIRIDVFPPSKWQKGADWWRDERKKKLMLNRNKPIVAKLYTLLRSFYSSRSVPYADQLAVIDVNDVIGSSYLEPLEGPLLNFLPRAKKKQRLRSYQNEMRTFGDFLRAKFFTDRRRT